MIQYSNKSPLTSGINFGVPALRGNTESERAVVDRTTVIELVFPRVQSPSLLAEVKLFSKSHTECFKVPSAGYFVAEVNFKLHFFNGHYKSWECLRPPAVRGAGLCVREGGGGGGDIISTLTTNNACYIYKYHTATDHGSEGHAGTNIRHRQLY